MPARPTRPAKRKPAKHQQPVPKRKPADRSKRVLKAGELQDIRTLADQLGRLLPLSGYRSKFSLAVVAKELKVGACLPKKSANKKEAFAAFLEDLFRTHPRMPKKLVRAILPRAIEKRHHEGDPVLAAEAEALVLQLKRLGIDMADEVAALRLPTERPRVVPPPIEIQKIVEAYKLHPRLLPDCQKLFLDGHVNDAVRKALDRFEATVQQLSGMPDKQGADLMAQAFNETNPRIALNALATPSEQSEQRGFKFIAMGIMQWWRNTLSHGDAATLPHQEAVARLFLISDILVRLDRLSST